MRIIPKTRMRHYVSFMLLLLAMMAHAADGKWAGTWATAIEPVGKNDLPTIWTWPTAP